MMRRFMLVGVAALLALTVAGCGNGAQPAPTGPEQSDGVTQPAPEPEAVAGEQLVATKCSTCHDLNRVEAADYDRAGWADTINRMQQQGLVVTDEEFAIILDYLAERDAAN